METLENYITSKIEQLDTAEKWALSKNENREARTMNFAKNEVKEVLNKLVDLKPID